MLLISNFGWNHPNKTRGLDFIRHKYETELFQAIVNHPYFHPTAWEDIRNRVMPINTTIRYYIFADVFQCRINNYPDYYNYTDNYDTRQGRPYVYHQDHSPQLMRYPWRRMTGWPHYDDFFEHPLLRESSSQNQTDVNHKATMVIFDCAPYCSQGSLVKFRDDQPATVVAMSAFFSQMNLDRDQGLVPPRLKKIQLSEEEEASIRNCDADNDPAKRPVKAVYIGASWAGDYISKTFNEAHNGGVRKAHFPFHNPNEGFLFQETKAFKQMIVANNNTISVQSENKTYQVKNASYEKVIRASKFAIGGRGDCKYSFRFTEVLSAGSILVHHADNFMMPFRPEIVDWNKCALVMQEKDAGRKTIELIKELLKKPDELCKRRQYCYFEIYKKYIETPALTLNGVLEGLEALARGERKPQAGFICNATSIKNLDCNPK